MEEFKSLGISFHNTPLEIREQVALTEAESEGLLLKMKEALGINEAMIVSTCNRTEIYYSSVVDLKEDILSLLSASKTLDRQSVKEFFRNHNTEEAIRHLFNVSLGLESMVLGDVQISNQVKRSYQTSADLDMAGPFLHRLMHTVFYANKRVVQETRLQDGNASVASVSVELVKGFIEHIENPRIALIGLGEIGQNVLENLSALDVSVTLLNRSKSKADKLAAISDRVTVAEFSELKEVIHKSDVVISAVSRNDGLTITPVHLDQNIIHHKLFIDLSVPRSIDERIDELPGVALYNIDQLTEKTEKARKIREKSIPEAKLIIEESVTGFDQWKAEMEVSPTINKLKKALDQIRKEELNRHSSKISTEEMELLDVVTKNMIQKVIKLPVIQLRAACKRGESETLVGVLNDLFNLEPDTVKKGE